MHNNYAFIIIEQLCFKKPILKIYLYWHDFYHVLINEIDSITNRSYLDHIPNRNDLEIFAQIENDKFESANKSDIIIHFVIVFTLFVKSSFHQCQ